MSRVALAVTALALAGGCQTFIRIEDVEGHLPHFDGDYAVGLRRQRADASFDTIRLVGTARLDPDTRELRLQLNMLNATTGASVSENAIVGLVFPDGASTVEFPLSIEIRDAAVTMPSANPADATVNATMLLHAEGDYAFCAEPADGAVVPTFGSILLAPGAQTPEVDQFDTGCDDLGLPP